MVRGNLRKGEWELQLGGLGCRQKSAEGRGPESPEKQLPVTAWRVSSYPPTWEKPTEAILVRIVYPLADPEDGDARRVLGLLWDRNRQDNQSGPASSPLMCSGGPHQGTRSRGLGPQRRAEPGLCRQAAETGSKSQCSMPSLPVCSADPFLKGPLGARCHHRHSEQRQNLLPGACILAPGLETNQNEYAQKCKLLVTIMVRI